MVVTKRKLSSEDLAEFVCSANDAIHFKFILDETDLEDKVFFSPEYTHQFFGDSENIFGYVRLNVQLIYSSCWLKPYFKLSCREKVKPSKTGGIEPDDVYKIISEKQELEPETSEETFKQSLSEESSFKPFGELLDNFVIENHGRMQKFCVFYANNSVTGFQEYHHKMQTLILWFIDGASFIDDEDEKWDYFVLHEEVEKNGVLYYPFVGYTTVYRYYAYPLKIRPRISQMLILPPYQKKGLGSHMLECIGNWYMSNSDVLDITVEDPSPEFVRIRDFVDCKRCCSLLSFSKRELLAGFSPKMIEEAQQRFKINKKQARRVYEILRFNVTDLNNLAAYKEYRLEVKNRLNIPFQREKLDLEKLQKSLPAEELKAAANPIPREQRIEQLDQMYQDLEARYRHIIERLYLECPDNIKHMAN